MSSTNISSMLRRIQSRKSIDAHVQVTNGDAVYYFNVFTKESSWEPPPNLFDWTVVIHDDGAMRFRNRVNGSTSQHVPITLTRVIKEDLRKLETPPTPASGVRPTGAGAGSGVGSGVRRAAAVTAVAAVPAVHVAVGDEVIAHHGSVMGGGGAEEAGAEPASGEGEVEDPADWASYLDEASGDDYWYNHKTGESRWEPPPIVEAALAAEPPALPSFGNGGGAGAPGQSAAAAAGDGSVRRQPASPPLADMKAVAAGTESAGVSRHSTDGGFDGGGDSSGDGYGGGSGGGDDGRGDDYGGGGGGGNGGGRGGGGHRGGYSGGGGGGGGGSRSRTSPLAVIVDHTLGNLSDPLRATLAQKGSPAVSPAMVATSAEQRRWKEDERRRRERNTKSRVTSAELRDRVSLLSMSISACILKALTWQEKRSVNVTQLRHQHQLGGNAATAHTKVGASYLWRLAYDGVDQFSVPSLFDCKVYAPSIFSKIRKQSGISNALFKHSFSHEVSNAALGVGKSGMLFFATSDNKFVIKTLKKGELAFLFHTKFLQDYFYHLTQHPRSRLIRFYGVYTLTVKGTDYHIVVMNNVLYTKDHDVVHKYDLKGSTKDRSVSTEDFRRGAVGKDLNFGANKIYLGPALKHDFMSQLAADVWFLQRNNVMDYSLFIGLAHPRKAADGSDAVVVVDDANPSHYSNVCKLWPQREHLHNIPWAREVEWHYFCAIVDILQPFDIKKKAESVIFQSNEEEISAVPSDYYGQRILDFVEGHCT